LAANATYWLAECHYAQGQYDKAARIFAESYKKYPKGPKVADSLLKMGMSLGGLGKTKEACVTLQQLKKEFPSGQTTALRRAEQEMTRLGCAR
ncbi:MAG: tetratricopeptide repeat protein, partial [Alphaproteobacteria bacterium]|nr:tetratricopeptide repeat protein [Alphaproteobacteria bacterium]